MGFKYKLLWVIGLFIFLIPFKTVHADTLEEQLNNLVGPKKQYSTYLSPVYLNANKTEEDISPQSGELSITQTDYMLPGRNGLDLEFKRIYKSGISNVQEMKVKYVNGAWVDYVYSDAKTSSFYEDRYNLGIGMRFSFPAIENRKNSDGSSHIFLHTENGDVYRLKRVLENGVVTYSVEGQTIKDITVIETSEFSNGQSDGTSKFMMTGKDGKKSYFTEDGRIIGIVDRYGNSIKFEYSTLTYTIDGNTITKKLISKITDTIGRIVSIEYKEDASFTVSPITNEIFSAEDSYKASQNPNNMYSGDLKGKFQVILHLPENKTIVYDKSAVYITPSKHVTRTRLQRVFDVDQKPKYHFWYEQPDLGFTYTNGTNYSVYNRYENLVQIDYAKTNRIKRYVYNTYTQELSDGSMQNRKIFSTQELVKKSFDPNKSNFLDRFITDVKDKTNYTYTNEPDGYGFSGYKKNDDAYLRNTYRYYTTITDIRGNTSKYTYDGVQQLLTTEERGADHKEIITTERDEMKLVKKKERLIYPVVNGQVIVTPIKKIENYRYDQYGNLTNYTGPEASRDEKGYPNNNEHTTVYSYAYDKFHAPTLKTWKKDHDTTSQIIYEVDNKGNVTKETRLNVDDENNNLIFLYQYDNYGNMIKKEAKSRDQSFVTYYDFGIDANGVDLKGAYMTKKYSLLDNQEIASRYAYDFNTGNLIKEIDPNENETTYQYDVLNRVVKVIQPDLSVKEYQYTENPYLNLNIQYKDPNNSKYLFEYDILGNLVKSSIYDNQKWNVQEIYEYDAKGNPTKKIDANGQVTQFEYDSQYVLKKKSYFENGSVFKGSIIIDYTVLTDPNTPLLITITDEEGYSKKFYYDILNRLTKTVTTPDKVNYFTNTFAYDYVGNKIRSTDALNNTTQVVYDDHGRVTKEIDALGNEKDYLYNANDKILFIKEPGGKVTENLYDDLGRILIQKTYLEGSNDHLYTKYTYDSVGNVTNIIRGQVNAGINDISSDTTYVYDKMNRMTDQFIKVDQNRKSHTKISYDKNGNKTEVVQYVDQEETKFRIFNFVYNYSGRLVEESGAYQEADGKGGYVKIGSFLKKYEYDREGNRIKEDVWNGKDFDPTFFSYNNQNKVKEKNEPYTNNQIRKVTKYEYDKVGNLISESNSVQGVLQTTSYVYDGNRKMIKEIDPLGNTKRYLYDGNSNLIKEVDSRYANLTLDQAPGIEYEYDTLNRQIKTLAFNGTLKEVISFKVYDSRGNVLKDVKGEGYDSSDPINSIGDLYEYDIHDRVITFTSAQTAKDNLINDTSFFSKKMRYDANGNKISEEDAYGNINRYTYYLNGMLKEQMDPLDNKESYDYDLTGKVIIVKTDKTGHQTKTYNNLFDKPYRIEYADGSDESFVYSPKGELIQSTDQEGYRKYYAYDPSGNLILKNEFIKSEQDYNYYKQTKSSFDEKNNLRTKETSLWKVPKISGLSEVIQSAGDKVEYIYDKAGRVQKSVGPNGRETIYEHDQAGNIVTKMVKVNEGYYDVYRYSYDLRSQLASESTLIKTSDIEIKYIVGAKYDKTYYDRVLATNIYKYNKNGQLISKTDPQGNITEFKYNLDNKLTKKIEPQQTITQYHYDLLGNLIEEINPKGVSTYYDYDSLNQLIRKKAPYSNGGLAITRYIYDKTGNLIKEISPNYYEEKNDAPTLVNEMLGLSYVYDPLNRRVGTLSPEGQRIEFIQYNKLGQIQKVVDGLRYTGDITTSKGTIYTYNGLGNTVKVTNSLEQTTTYQYDVLSNLTKQTDARGNSTSFNYYPDGTLNKIIYADNGTITYTYDKLGRKTIETNQLGNTTTYTYNAFGKENIIKDPYQNTITSKYDLNGNLVSQKDKRGSIILFKYDSQNRLTEKKTPLELDGSNNIVYSIETYQYDKIGNLTKQTIKSSKDPLFLRETSYSYTDNSLLESVSNQMGLLTKNTYDKNGNLIKVEKTRGEGVSDIEKYEYDTQNRVIKHIRLIDEEDIYKSESIPNINNLRDQEYPNKIQIINGYQYDLLGNKVKETSPNAYHYLETDIENRNQYSTTYKYDLLNRIERIIQKFDGRDIYKQYTYDEVGNKIVEKNERGYSTQFLYDPVNRVSTIIDSKQNRLTYLYDLAGNKISETNSKNDSMTYSYDKLNRLVTITDPYEVIITKKIYDANGNVIKQIDAKGMKSGDNDQTRYGKIYTYDLSNRLIKIVDPEIEGWGDPTKYTAKYQYNPLGEKVKEIDALGNEQIYEYDIAGRLVKVTDALGVSISFGYDQVGNKLYMVDGRGKMTRYGYSAFGLIKEVINAENYSILYHYDLNLLVAEMTDKNGYHIHYTYDNRKLLISHSVEETNDQISFAFDEVGNRILMVDESGQSTYIYDELNRIQNISKDGDLQIRYTYDSVSNITSVTDIVGTTTSYTYDRSNRMDTVNNNGHITRYTYDENGNRKLILYPGGVKEEYTFDKNNRLLTLTNKKSNGNVISSYSYTYDLAGKQVSKTDHFGTTNYTYDTVGRITKVEAPGKTTIYTYDHAGNRQSLNETYTSAQPSGYTDPTTNLQIKYNMKKSEYIYSNTNTLLKLIETMFDGSGKEVLQKTVNYLYDNNGNELRQNVSYLLPYHQSLGQSTSGNLYGDNITDPISTLFEKVSNTYDGFNRLKRVDKIKGGERVVVEYLYNGDGLRTKQLAQNSKNGYTTKETNYLYDRQHVILETDANNKNIVSYIRGINYIGRINGSSFSYYLYNGHGDVVQTVSETGDIENQYDYDIFGNPTLTIETNYSNAIRYSGEFYDEETGLYYLRARYYNPYIGRFISEDSYWGEDTNPLSFNLYTYAHNNPIMFIDPTGHWAEGDSKYSAAAQAQIAEATNDYWNAYYSKTMSKDEKKKKMDVAHQRAEAARKGIITPQDRTTPTEIKQNVVSIFANSKISNSAKEDLSNSDITKVAYAPNTITAKSTPKEEAAFNEAKNILTQINLTRKDPKLEGKLEPITITYEDLLPLPKGVNEKNFQEYVENVIHEKMKELGVASLGAYIDGSQVLDIPDFIVNLSMSAIFNPNKKIKGNVADNITFEGAKKYEQNNKNQVNESNNNGRNNQPNKPDTNKPNDPKMNQPEVSNTNSGNQNNNPKNSSGNSVEGGVNTLDDITIINKKYAGQTFDLTGDLAKKYPNGVKFTSEGFPDFGPYSNKTVTVKGLQGDAYYDFIKANQAAGYKTTPKGFTWHHVEDGTTMMLVPTDLHGAVRHTGGASLIRKGIRP